jgi:hypothetical protein
LPCPKTAEKPRRRRQKYENLIFLRLPAPHQQLAQTFGTPSYRA